MCPTQTCCCNGLCSTVMVYYTSMNSSVLQSSEGDPLTVIADVIGEMSPLYRGNSFRQLHQSVADLVPIT